jgi:hypothetical protein
MTNNDVTVQYSEYTNNPVAKEISFELLPDILLSLKYEADEESVSISMSDTISANTELEGKLDYDGLNVLIRALTQLRNQIKDKRK